MNTNFVDIGNLLCELGEPSLEAGDLLAVLVHHVHIAVFSELICHPVSGSAGQQEYHHEELKKSLRAVEMDKEICTHKAP